MNKELQELYDAIIADMLDNGKVPEEESVVDIPFNLSEWPAVLAWIERQIESIDPIEICEKVKEITI